MGHSKASKAITHARVVQAAARRFKERGIDGISLADLMKELRLTHGGFYKHFGSRDELVAEALQLALTETGRAMQVRLFTDGKADIDAFLDFYLDTAHRDQRATGCAVAALAGDAARKSTDVQALFRKSIEANLRSLSEAIAAKSEKAAGSIAVTAESRAAALLVLSALYGALIMARAVGDSPLSSEILDTVRRQISNLTAPVKKPRTPTRVPRVRK
jgi:TetR/AcrR family transcriptional regulator, transcriptional repressor for nem operon